MRRALALAVAAMLCCAACSATAAQTPPSSPSSTHVSALASTPTPAPARTTPHVVVPTAPAVPADVPRTGPNTRPGEKPPVLPVLATQHTAAGARAFAEFFIKTIDWGYATTSSTYMRHYFTKSCSGCLSFAAAMDHDRLVGHKYIGGRLTVRSVTSSLPNSAIVTVDGTSREVVSHAGRFVSGDPAYPNLQFIVTTTWRPGWITNRIAVRP